MNDQLRPQGRGVRGRGSAWLLGALLSIAAAPAWAQHATLELEADRHLVGVGEVIQITVRVQVEGATALGAYTPPPTPGFRPAGRTMRSQQMRVDQFSRRVERTDVYTYSLMAEETGEYTLGPATVEVGGRLFRSPRINVTVRNSAAPNTPQGTPGTPAPPPPPTGHQGDDAMPSVFIDASATPKTVYVGQQMIAEWRLYTQVSISGYDILKEPVADGFWSEDLAHQRLRQLGRQVVQDRVYYTGTLLRKALFPQRAGTLRLGELEVRLELPSGSFFFDKTETRKSPAVEIEVLPLPRTGQPANFPAQNVGQFEIAATLDRNEVEVGEAVKLTLTVRGSGNLRQLALPDVPKIAGLKVYEPKVSETLTSDTEVSGEKLAVYLLVPTEPGLLKLPALALPYFDPQRKRYGRVTTTELALRVTGKAVGEAYPTSVGGATNVIGPDIRPPRPARMLEDRPPTKAASALNLVLLGLPLVALLLVFGGERLRTRLTQPSARSRERAAARRVHQQLELAASHQDARDKVAFFAALAAAINGQLRHQMQCAVEGLTRAELRQRMSQAGFSAELVEETVQELDRCDAERFSPGDDAPEQLAQALLQSRRLVQRIVGAQSPRGRRKTRKAA